MLCCLLLNPYTEWYMFTCLNYGHDWRHSNNGIQTELKSSSIDSNLRSNTKVRVKSNYPYGNFHQILTPKMERFWPQNFWPYCQIWPNSVQKEQKISTEMAKYFDFGNFWQIWPNSENSFHKGTNKKSMQLFCFAMGNIFFENCFFHNKMQTCIYPLAVRIWAEISTTIPYAAKLIGQLVWKQIYQLLQEKLTQKVANLIFNIVSIQTK